MSIRDRIRMKTVGTGAMVAIAMTIGLAFAALSFGSSLAFAHTTNYYIGYNDGRSAAYRPYYFNISCPTDQPHTSNYCAGYADGFSEYIPTTPTTHTILTPTMAMEDISQLVGYFAR